MEARAIAMIGIVFISIKHKIVEAVKPRSSQLDLVSCSLGVVTLNVHGSLLQAHDVS